jgi:hypothetical protein
VVDARLHDADVIAHDEQDIRFLVLRLGWGDSAGKRSGSYKQRQAVMNYVSFHFCLLLLFCFGCVADLEINGDSEIQAILLI